MNEKILDSLQFEEQIEAFYPLASKGKRFANYMIDSIAYLILSFFIGIFIAVYAELFGDGMDSLDLEDDSAITQIWDYILGVVIITIYYSTER